MSSGRGTVWIIAAGIAAVVGICGMFGGLIIFAVVGVVGDNAAAQSVSCNTTTAGVPELVDYYSAAAKQYKLGSDGYAYLAAINDVETSFGTNLAVSSAGAVGWMQFEPATFTEYAVSVTDPDAPADPDDPQDAIYTAANMLSADGAPGDWSDAIYAYNHADWYVSEVETDAKSFEGAAGLTALQTAINTAWGDSSSSGSSSDCPTSSTSTGSGTGEEVSVNPVPGQAAVILPNGLAEPPSDAPKAVQDMVQGGDQILDFDYQWGGGHSQPALSDNLSDPQPQGGTEAGQNGTPGYDCSGSTDYDLWAGGFGNSVLGGGDPASDELMGLGVAGQGKWVTWWAQDGHVFISIAGIIMDTVHGPTTVEPSGAPSTGPRWASESQVSYEFTYDGTFVPRHPEGM